MCEPFRVSYVVEGKTDFIVLDALVGSFLGGLDYISNRIQPPISDYAGDQGSLGGGWKGVLRWCENQGEESTEVGGFANSLVMRNCDCLVIHIDADIAEEADLTSLGLGSADSPASTCDNVRNYLTSLFGECPPSSRLVMCIPAQCTETWVFVALYANEAERYRPIEGRREVERLLIGRPERLVRDKDGAAKKDPKSYCRVVDTIIQNWALVVAGCTQARLFESSFRTLL